MEQLPYYTIVPGEVVQFLAPFKDKLCRDSFIPQKAYTKVSTTQM